jgi:hypothetical protein
LPDCSHERRSPPSQAGHGRDGGQRARAGPCGRRRRERAAPVARFRCIQEHVGAARLDGLAATGTRDPPAAADPGMQRLPDPQPGHRSLLPPLRAQAPAAGGRRGNEDADERRGRAAGGVNVGRCMASGARAASAQSPATRARHSGAGRGRCVDRLAADRPGFLASLLRALVSRPLHDTGRTALRSGDGRMESRDRTGNAGSNGRAPRPIRSGCGHAGRARAFPLIGESGRERACCCAKGCAKRAAGNDARGEERAHRAAFAGGRGRPVARGSSHPGRSCAGQECSDAQP